MARGYVHVWLDGSFDWLQFHRTPAGVLLRIMYNDDVGMSSDLGQVFPAPADGGPVIGGLVHIAPVHADLYHRVEGVSPGIQQTEMRGGWTRGNRRTNLGCSGAHRVKQRFLKRPPRLNGLTTSGRRLLLYAPFIWNRRSGGGGKKKDLRLRSSSDSWPRGRCGTRRDHRSTWEDIA